MQLKVFILLQFIPLLKGCDHVMLTDPEGYITSPNYPNPYDDYADCRWLIQAPYDEYRVLIYFVGPFVTQTGFDRLTFYDGNTTSAPVLLDWSGPEYFYPWIATKTSQMLVQFTTLRGDSYSGFKLRYYTEKKQKCGGILTGPSGRFASPGFPAEPSYYDNNVDCIWRIEAAKNERIKLTFSNFTTEPGRDTVTVIDPALENSVVMAHSGRTLPAETISVGSVLLVQFQTDAYMHDIPGFLAEYNVFVSL